MVVEVRAGEAGVMRAALGEVLGMQGIDARVRLFLWSGGVADVTLPVLNGARYAGGAQVVVMFLSDRPESGVILGAMDGNLSWRRLGPEAWAQQMRPAIERVMAQALREPGTVAVTPDFFAGYGDPGDALSTGCVLLPDGRVFLIPAIGGKLGLVLDPDTLALHALPWPGTTVETFEGGCLLRDGRVLVVPGTSSAVVGQAYLYDPALDRVTPAGQPLAQKCGGCTLLTDGRALIAPSAGEELYLYDPAANEIRAVPLGLGQVNCVAPVLLPDGRVLLVPLDGPMALFDPATETATVVTGPWLPEDGYGGGVLLADGRVLLVPNAAQTPMLVWDPVSGTATPVDGTALSNAWRRGGCLLPDGRVLLPDEDSLPASVIYDPATNALAPMPELAAVPPAPDDTTAYTGGCSLPDGRVVFGPGLFRDLVIWNPGCGVGLGRDVVLSGWWNRA